MYIKHKKNHTYAREKVYAVYKGDKFKMTGTWFEVLDELKISESTLRYYLSNSYRNRIDNKDHKRIIIEIIEEN